jgi:hypothetical protein
MPPFQGNKPEFRMARWPLERNLLRFLVTRGCPRIRGCKLKPPKFPNGVELFVTYL